MNRISLNHVQNLSCVAMSSLRPLQIRLRPTGKRIFFSFLLIFATAGICCADIEKNTSIQNQSITGNETNSESETSFIPKETSILENPKLVEFKTLLQKTSLIHIFKKGGPIMWPLLLASILAMGTVLERVFFLFIEKCRRDKKAIKKFFEAVRQADFERAMQISEKSKFYVVRTLGYALTHKGKSISNALLYAQEEEMKRFRRGIPILDTIITLAPLLGLLGTVTGMMGSFSLIGGELSAPGAITGGIAEALIATAFGLGIAITSLIPFNFLNTKMEEAGLEIESAATQLELLMHPQKKMVPVTQVAYFDITIEEEEYVQFI